MDGMDIAMLLLSGFSLAVFLILPMRLLGSVYHQDPNYSHGYLVWLFAVFLACQKRTSFRAAPARTSVMGFVPLLLGCGLVVVGHWYRIALQPGYLGHVFLQGIGLWLTVSAAIWILAGGSRLRIMAPVLGFMVFSIPWPESFTLPVTRTLQRLVAVSSAHLFRSLGIEVFRDGNLLHLPNAVLGVAEACSGIRSLMAFLAVTAACAVVFKLGLLRTLVLFLLAPLAAVASNVLRILITGILVLNGNADWMHGSRHDLLGLAVILCGGGMLLSAARALKKGEGGPPGTSGLSPPGPGPHAKYWPSALATSAVLLVAVTGMHGISRHYAGMMRPDPLVPVARLPLEQFPRVIGDFQCTSESNLSAAEYDLLKPSEQLVRMYEDPQGNWVLVTVLYWKAQLTYPGSPAVLHYPHTPYSCMWGAGWTRETAYDRTDFPDWLAGMPLYMGGFVKAGRERIVLFWNTNTEEDPRPFSPKDLRRRWHLLVGSWDRVPRGILPATYSVRIETDIQDEFATANEIALQFARRAAVALPEYGIGRRKNLPEGTQAK